MTTRTKPQTAFGQKLHPILHHNCLPSLSKSLLNVSVRLIDSQVLAYLHFRSISFRFDFREDEASECFSSRHFLVFHRETLDRGDVYSHIDESSSRAVAIH